MFSDEITNNFVVYSFEELFAELYNVNLEENYHNEMMNEIIAAMYLKKDPFDYKSSLCCDVSWMLFFNIFPIIS